MASTPPYAPYFAPNLILPAVQTPPIPFDNGIVDTPSIQDQPDNGPNVPPRPHGEQPSGAYEYLLVPKLKPLPPEEPFYCSFGVYQQIETQFALLSVYAERADLINGERVYRVPAQYIWKFPFDAIGPFIGYAPQPTFRFLVTDPSIGQGKASCWTPVLA